MINYRTCEAMNHNFQLTDNGAVACPAAEVLIYNSLQRAYILCNLFFYDIVQREVGKLTQRIMDKRTTVIQSSGMAEDAVEKQFVALSNQFAAELGDHSLDPLIKAELGKIKPLLALQLTKAEQKQLDEMYHAICADEISKFKAAVLFPNQQDKPYTINFSQKFLDNLPERSRRCLKPTIKMLAYLDGQKFTQFDLSPDQLHLTYTWDPQPVQFDEEKLKDELKSVIAKKPHYVV